MSWADMSDQESVGSVEKVEKVVVNMWAEPIAFKKELIDSISIEEPKEELKETPKETPKEEPKETPKEIKCRDCKKIFVWSVKEQRFYNIKGYSPPKTCRECKSIRKTMGPPPRHRRKKILDV